MTLDNLTTLMTERKDGRRRVPDRQFVMRIRDVPHRDAVATTEALVAEGRAAEVPVDFISTADYRLAAFPRSAFDIHER